MDYSVLELSKYVVTKCVNDMHPINNVKLQKILYYIQKDFLKRGERAFWEDIEAWQFGPVIPSVYYRFCSHGSMPIRFTYTTDISRRDKVVIDRIIENISKLNTSELNEDVYKKNGAWEKIYNNGLGNKEIIPEELILEEN